MAYEAQILQFWGKAQPARDGPRWHPLAYHSLDVAAVGATVLARNELLRGRIAYLMGLDQETAVRFLTCMLALHDLGKFSRPFQIKVPDLYPELLGGIKAPSHPHHDAAGLLLWVDTTFAEARGKIAATKSVARKLRPWLGAVVGHHGAPVDPETAGSIEEVFGKGACSAATAFGMWAADHLLCGPITNIEAVEAHRLDASWLLAGLAVLADWIGSNQNWFPYRAPDLPLDQYWNGVALPQAKTAFSHAGISTTQSADAATFQTLFEASYEPSPVQSWAETVSLPEGPLLILIEDVTGSGKTEAAIMLVHRLMTARRADGLFIGLPTMATANAMYERLGSSHRRLFARSGTPSLILSHSARDLHPGFRSDVLDAGQVEIPYSFTGDFADEPASRMCAAWIADDRRRGFLADVGVGTVDQVILSVLPSRHQSLRLLGLANKVLVVDEVHAYDAYMSQELATLIGFQAAFGGSTIMLSATLPQAQRTRLLSAFSRSVSGGEPLTKTERLSGAYPLVTMASASGFEEMPCEVRNQLKRSLPVNMTNSQEEVVLHIQENALRGAAVCWIRNTVDEAIDAYTALSAAGLTVDLFHARFALSDRLGIEEQVLRRFGKNSTANDRRGHVLVATQVVEQSLDIDFDFMVTDLAPIDLVIQRAGRLCRHDRTDRPVAGRLLVLSPEPVHSAGDDWAPRGTVAVYKNAALLWLTALALKEFRAIEAPGNVRALVEFAYGKDGERQLPESLIESLYEAEGRAGADGGIAQQNLLKRAAGYVRDAGLWETDIKTPTRLGEPQTTLRLARWEDSELHPWAKEATPQLAWRLSEISVSRARIDGQAPNAQPVERQLDAARSRWSKWDVDKVIVPLAPNCDGGWNGKARCEKRSGESADVLLSYDNRRGLMFMD